MNATDRKEKFFFDMPFGGYLDLPGVNRTSLMPLITQTAAHYRQGLVTRQESTAARDLGTFAHSLALEPEKLLGQYVVEPTERFKLEARTKSGDIPASPTNTDSFRRAREKFRKENYEKEIVTADAYERVQHISRAVWNHESAREHLQGARARECVMRWRDDACGLLCKARLDATAELGHVIVELKTTADIFRFNLLQWGYDVQAAFYLDGYETLTGKQATFFLIVAETVPPYSVQAAPVGRAAIMVGRKKYKQALRELAECQKKDVWPGPADPGEWTVPEYEVAKYF